MSRTPGIGCYGDPPGYPSYYIRNAFVGGNSSHREGAPDVIIRDPESVDHVLRRVGGPALQPLLKRCRLLKVFRNDKEVPLPRQEQQT